MVTHGSAWAVAAFVLLFIEGFRANIQEYFVFKGGGGGILVSV